MPRTRTGWTGQDAEGRWFYRYQYTDSFGKRRNVRRLATSEANAKSHLRKALNKQENGGGQIVEGERLKFSKLASEYAKKKIFEPDYVGERKVAGLRSYKSVELLLEILKTHFTDKRISTITHSDVEEYKLKRLRTPKLNGGQRSIASVNRELELLRAMLRFAVREGWLVYSPFERGAPLISKADEVRRERVLTSEEERRLLDACGDRTITYIRGGKEVTVLDKGEKRKHLRALLIAALDTAARRGELLQLLWSDVDFDNRLIHLRATTTKTATARIVGITQRLYDELQKLWEDSPKIDDLEVFGGIGSIKKSFASLCDDAGVHGFRFHDCRHTAITRMIDAGMPTAKVMKISGHTQMITFQRYVNPNDDSARQAATLLDNFNTKAKAEQQSAELIN
jgi:integrase